MTKTIYELREERQQAELAALSATADAASAAADVNLDAGENTQLVDALSPAQSSKLLAQAQYEVLREAREQGRNDYEDAHLTYASLVQQRRAELLELLFGGTSEMNPGDLDRILEASEEELEAKAEACALSGN